jgi:hypothetical protein
MTSDPIRRDEEETEDEVRLRRLFDASAAELSGPTLTKLRARAREVPERVPRAPRWLPRWAWSPLLASFAVGAGALAVAIGVWVRGPDGASPAPASGPQPVATQQAKPATLAPSVASSGSAAPEADDAMDDDAFLDEGTELAADFDLDVDQSYLDFDPLADPDDRELDAWWDATEDMLEGG